MGISIRATFKGRFILAGEDEVFYKSIPIDEETRIVMSDGIAVLLKICEAKV